MPCFEDGILYPFFLYSGSYILSDPISTMFCEPLSAILNYFDQFYFFYNFIHNPCVTPTHPSPLPTLPIIPFKFMTFSLIIIDTMLLSLSTIKIKIHIKCHLFSELTFGGLPSFNNSCTYLQPPVQYILMYLLYT